MAVSAKLVIQTKVTETLTDTSLVASGGDASVLHNAFDVAETYAAGTTVPATKVSAQVVALSAGAKTLDLTALTGTNGAALTAAGLKLQIWRLKNLGAADMTFTFGASDPYLALGAGFLFILKSGQHACFFLNDLAPDVGSGSTDIDVSGTGTQTFQNLMVFG
jgi:hypothetical protein